MELMYLLIEIASRISSATLQFRMFFYYVNTITRSFQNLKNIESYRRNHLSAFYIFSIMEEARKWNLNNRKNTIVLWCSLVVRRQQSLS